MTAHSSAAAPRCAHMAALAAAAALLALCRTAAAQDPGPTGASGQGGESVATIGGEKITRAQLEAYVAPQLMKLRQERQDVLEKGLDSYLSNQVLTREAKAQGVSVQDLLEQEVTSKVQAPTDAEIDTFYEQNKDRIQGTKEQLVGRIKEYLTQQRRQQGYDDYTSTLKKKYGAEVLLEPLRVAVDSPDAPSRGPADAPVTIVEFGDFECPYCGGLEPTLEKVRKNYAGKVRLVFRQYPLNGIHPLAAKASEAAMCAKEQGKFWELHDRMYAHQDALEVDDLKKAAAELGMDADRFDKCVDSNQYEAAIQADLRAGLQAGVNGTPALFVNGRPVPGGAVQYEVLANVIDEELMQSAAR
jgi:protein-disulfide isomerase